MLRIHVASLCIRIQGFNGQKLLTMRYFYPYASTKDVLTTGYASSPQLFFYFSLIFSAHLDPDLLFQCRSQSSQAKSMRIHAASDPRQSYKIRIPKNFDVVQNKRDREIFSVADARHFGTDPKPRIRHPSSYYFRQ